MNKLIFTIFSLLILSISVQAQIIGNKEVTVIRVQNEAIDPYIAETGNYADNSWEESNAIIWWYDERIIIENGRNFSNDLTLDYVDVRLDPSGEKIFMFTSDEIEYEILLKKYEDNAVQIDLFRPMKYRNSYFVGDD